MILYDNSDVSPMNKTFEVDDVHFIRSPVRFSGNELCPTTYVTPVLSHDLRDADLVTATVSPTRLRPTSVSL